MSDELMIESYNLYLLHACRNGNELGAQQVPVVVTLLEKGADVNTRDELGNTPLHWVCHSLRNKDSNMQEKDNQDHSGHAGTLIIILLRNGANQFACNKSGWMPLHFAANVGNTVAVNLLLFETAMTMSNRRKATQPVENFITGACAKMSEASRAVLYLVDHVRQRLYTSYFESGTRQLHTFAIAMNEGIEGMVYNSITVNDTKTLTEDPEWIHVGNGHFIYKSDDVTENTFFSASADIEMDFRTKNLLGVPIYSTKQMKKDSERIGLNDEKKLIGVIMLMNKKPRIDAAGNVIDLDPSAVHFDESNCKTIYEVINGSGAFNVAIEMMAEIDTPLHYILGTMFNELKGWAMDVHQYQSPQSAFVGKPVKELGFIADSMFTKQRSLKFQISLGDLETEEEEEKLSYIEKSINAGINAQVESLHSPIIRATMSGQKRMVLQLLNAGGEPYTRSATGNTALHVAASQGFHRIAQILVDAVCDPFELNNAGFSPRDLCDAHLVLELEKLEKSNQNLELPGYAKYKSLHDITQGKIERITILEGIAFTLSETDDGEDEILLSNSIYDFLACNQYMLTHRLLLAAEAIWLRVLHRGHVNTWYDKDFANVHNIYYPITQDLKHCPLRGKDEIAHKSLIIPVPSKPKEVLHSIKTVIENDSGTTYLCKVTFRVDKMEAKKIKRCLLYCHPYGEKYHLVETDQNNQHFFALEMRKQNIEDIDDNECSNITFIFGIKISNLITVASRKAFGKESTFTVVLENSNGQSRCSSASEEDSMSVIEPSITMYNAIIAMYGNHENFKMGFEETIFNEMEEKGIVRTADTYNILISIYCKTNNIEIAENFFKELKKKNLMPNKYTYYPFVNFFGKEDQYKDKLGIYLTDMRNMKLGLNAKSLQEDGNQKIWEIIGAKDYGAREYLDKKRFEKARNERLLRLDMQNISNWRKRGFSPPCRSDLRLFEREIELSSRQLLEGEAYKRLEDGKVYQLLSGVAYKSQTERKEYKHDSDFHIKTGTGFLGSQTCRFIVKRKNSKSNVPAISNQRIQIPRGTTAISFEFQSHDGKAFPIFKNRRKSAYIKVAPIFVTKNSIYSTSMITKIPIVSENIVLAKSSIGFGNNVMTVFFDRHVFTMSGVVYKISIPSGSLYFGTPMAVGGNPRSASKRIEREVIIDRGQALWDRQGKCPIEVRRLVLNELQCAKLRQATNTHRHRNSNNSLSWWPIWAQKTPMLVYPLKEGSSNKKSNDSTEYLKHMLQITFKFYNEKKDSDNSTTTSCKDIVIAMKEDIRNAYYNALRGGSFYVGNIDKDIITITKIVQNENKIMQNQVFVEFQISVNPDQVNIMLMKVSKLKFKKSVVESINQSYNEKCDTWENDEIRQRKMYLDIGKKVTNSNADEAKDKSRERTNTLSVKIKITRRSQVNNANAFNNDRVPDGFLQVMNQKMKQIMLKINYSSETKLLSFNSLKGKIEPALYVKEHLPNIQKGFATNIAIHLIELLVKNKKDLLKGGLLLETYAPSNLLINFEAAGIAENSKTSWRSKENIEIDKRKQGVECNTCYHVIQQKHFRCDSVSGIECFHCAQKCHVCGHMTLQPKERASVIRYLRGHREFPLPQMKYLKQISRASLFYGIISRDMILYRQYPKLLLAAEEINKMSHENEDDKASIKDSGTFDDYNFEYSRRSWNMADPVGGWAYSWPEMLILNAITCYNGKYNGPFLMSDARKLKIQNFLAGILDDVTPSQPAKSAKNTISDDDKEEEKKGPSINVLKFMVKMKKKGEESKKKLLNEKAKSKKKKSLFKSKAKQVKDLLKLKGGATSNGANNKPPPPQATSDSALFSFFACFSTRNDLPTKSKPTIKLNIDPVNIVANSGATKNEKVQQPTADVSYNSDEDLPSLGTLDFEIKFQNSTSEVCNNILEMEDVDEIFTLIDDEKKLNDILL